MKKKLFIVLMISLFLAPLAIAADWTAVAVTKCDGSPFPWEDKLRLYCYDISVTSNADSSGNHTLTTLLQTAYPQTHKKLHRELQGSVLYWVDYFPDQTDTPTSESTITIEKEWGKITDGVLTADNGYEFFSEAVGTAANSEGWPGSIDTGLSVPIFDITLSMTTLANTKKAVVRLWFLGGKK